MAAFARSVADAARRGDPVAAGIWRDAARELAASAAACARRLFRPGEPVTVSWAGGLFRAADLLLEPFLEEVLAALPDAVPRPPAGDALSGAAQLAGAAAGGSAGAGALARFVHDPASPSGAGGDALHPSPHAPALT